MRRPVKYQARNSGENHTSAAVLYLVIVSPGCSDRCRDLLDDPVREIVLLRVAGGPSSGGATLFFTDIVINPVAGLDIAIQAKVVARSRGFYRVLQVEPIQ
jgi:hypothetical protein